MSADDMLLLDRAAVERCLAAVDPVAVVETTLRAHADGRTQLPAEGYLSWTNRHGAYSRSLAMLGSVTDPEPVYGLKVVNAATSNPGFGLDRAGGVAMLFDPETARPAVLAEAAVLSALRTAAYTVLSLRHLGPESPDAVSVLGCGALARTHLRLLAKDPGITRAFAHDLDPARAHALRDWAATEIPSVTVDVVPDAESCVAASSVLITVTTSSSPYIPPSWFTRPTFVAHVSLDDVDTDVFREAEAVYVDDLELVVDNPRRILGALLGAGTLDPDPSGARPRVEGSLADVLDGRVPAVRPVRGNVVSNPFGMAVLDVALLAAVVANARATGEGVLINLVDGLRANA
ncbi:ornithine cyclodeaminase [Lentzea fradiae]|uniref:Ornithine cyclodeaminase n=1 Tax=Lentzea fradiae TaxID=200378 RepID=A0A1G8CU02_9PSEU|nr:ornithine cyclodeaminase family protein [Lentzea fradiae]SDH48744.1 ornithine cyclodeaminase [Lentzea fradiae]